MKIKTALCHLFYKNKLIFTRNLLIQMLNLNATITYKNMKIESIQNFHQDLLLSIIFLENRL